jgi:hypothetical protein
MGTLGQVNGDVGDRDPRVRRSSTLMYLWCAGVAGRYKGGFAIGALRISRLIGEEAEERRKKILGNL